MASPSTSSRSRCSTSAWLRCGPRAPDSSPNARSASTSPSSSCATRHQAVVLAVGALRGRDNEVPGRELDGVHLAMEHLVPANKECEGDASAPISAAGKHVVIIGGGDTGADCLGTAHRQGAASVTQLDYNTEPPETQRRRALAVAHVAAGAAHLPGPRRRWRAPLRGGRAAVRRRRQRPRAGDRDRRGQGDPGRRGPPRDHPGGRVAADSLRPGAAGHRFRGRRTHGRCSTG